ncbi:Mitoferrin-like protein, partial [Globisporangium splendens]
MATTTNSSSSSGGGGGAPVIDEDWEEWTPEKGSFLHHMLAGSVAGVAEHVSIFPIDTIKVRRPVHAYMLNGKPLKLSATQTARKLIAEEGPLRLFRGVSTMLSASLPAHAVYFSVFEAMKKTLGADSADHTPIASGAAGVVATVCHDMIMTPMDVIKQRLQLGYYSGVTDCFKTIVRQEGFRALYISFPTTFFMNLPYSMIMVSANETFKKILNPSGEMNISAYFASGAMAGALAGVLTNPLDVAKTRLQTQLLLVQEDPSVRPRAATATTASFAASQSGLQKMIGGEPKMRLQYRGLFDALVQIRAQEGTTGFFRGVYPRLLVQAPSVAVSWTTFECHKDSNRPTSSEEKNNTGTGSVSEATEVLRSRSFSRKKPTISSNHEATDELRGADPPVTVTQVQSPPPSSQGDESDLRRGMQVAAEQSGEQQQQQSTVLLTSTASPTAASSGMSTSSSHPSSSSRLSFLRRAMRSKSDGNIRVAAVAQGEKEAEADTCEKELDNAPPPVALPLKSESLDSDTEPSHEANPGEETPSPAHEDIKQREDSFAAASAASEVFLNASIQLLYVQSDARQRVRQLWFTVQRLRWEGQLSDTGMELLHIELLAILKSLNMEKLDGPRHLKSGYLTLIHAPYTAGGKPPGAMAKALFPGKHVVGQHMWCTLSEEHGKLEMTPVRDEIPPRNERMALPAGDNGNSASTSGIASLAGLSNKFKLPTSLSWLLTDSQQGPGHPEPARTIKLHGCQVRRIQIGSTRSRDSSSFPFQDSGASMTRGSHQQIQILVPIARNSPDPSAATSAFWSETSESSHESYGIFAFEVVESDGGEAEIDAWMNALDRVTMFHLYMLERSIRDVQHVDQYRHVLARHFPLCISLSWLRNRIETHGPLQSHAGHHNQQQQMHQQQQRRSSRNLSMIQIIKDLERDKVLVDQKLISTDSSNPNRSEQDNISEVIKYIVMKVMAFGKQCEQHAKQERGTRSGTNLDAEIPASSSSPSAPLPPHSPTNRFTKYTEAKALTFVERVLRGSSRTQSGGDIYDAISFFCQHQRVSICPISHDACPVQMSIVSDEELGVFQIEIHVRMRFKVVEMAPMTSTTPSSSPPPSSSLDPSIKVRSPPFASSFTTAASESPEVGSFSSDGLKEWAILEGTLSRQFTLGKLSEPGAITIDYIQEQSHEDVMEA